MPVAGFGFQPLPADNYQMFLGIALDRLRSLSTLLMSLLRCVCKLSSPAQSVTRRRCSTPRPVSVPVGALANLTLRMISVSAPAEDGDVCGPPLVLYLD